MANMLRMQPGDVANHFVRPSPESAFKDELLTKKRAWFTIKYRNGREEIRPWRADNFTVKSSLMGNLRSRPEFRQGEWQRCGIREVIVSITQPRPKSL